MTEELGSIMGVQVVDLTSARRALMKLSASIRKDLPESPDRGKRAHKMALDQIAAVMNGNMNIHTGEDLNKALTVDMVNRRGKPKPKPKPQKEGTAVVEQTIAKPTMARHITLRERTQMYIEAYENKYALAPTRDDVRVQLQKWGASELQINETLTHFFDVPATLKEKPGPKKPPQFNGDTAKRSGRSRSKYSSKDLIEYNIVGQETPATLPESSLQQRCDEVLSLLKPGQTMVLLLSSSDAASCINLSNTAERLKWGKIDGTWAYVSRVFRNKLAVTRLA